MSYCRIGKVVARRQFVYLVQETLLNDARGWARYWIELGKLIRQDPFQEHSHFVSK